MKEVVRFGSVSDAVAWAEEILSKDGVPSHLRISKAGTGEFTFEELKDFAHTISAVVARVQPLRAQYIYRHIYGYSSSEQVLHVMIMAQDYMHRSRHWNKDKAVEQAVRLSAAVVDAVRSELLFNKRHPYAKVAKALNIKPQSFHESWKDLFLSAKVEAFAWVHQAETQIQAELEEKGMMG